MNRLDRTVGHALFDVLHVTVEKIAPGAELQLTRRALVTHVVPLVDALELDLASSSKTEALGCRFFRF